MQQSPATVNCLKAVHFDRPDWIPASVNLLPAAWLRHGEELDEVARGKVCVFLDLDRQLFPFATPQQARAHIVEAKKALYMPEGGLMLKAACAHDVDVSVVRAICETYDCIGCGPMA